MDTDGRGVDRSGGSLVNMLWRSDAGVDDLVRDVFLVGDGLRTGTVGLE